MPIISKVEAGSTRGKIIFAAIILLLTAGGATMVYPFLIMVSGTLRSEMDEKDLDLLPSYLIDDRVLYRKFLETKYNQKVEHLNRAHGRLTFSFRGAAVPATPNAQRIDDLREFLRKESIPFHWQMLGGIEGIKTVPENLRRLTGRVRSRFSGDLTALSRELGTSMRSWDLRGFRVPDYISFRYDFTTTKIFEEYLKLTEQTPWPQRQLVSISGYFVETMIIPVYGRKDTDTYNKAHVVAIDEFKDYVLPRTVPPQSQSTLRAEWIEFVTKELNAAFVSLEAVPNESYQSFLHEKYQTAEALSRNWGQTVHSFEQIALQRNEWLSGSRRRDYLEFLATQPVERYLLTGPEYAWRDWLTKKYSSLAALNEAHQSSYRNFTTARIPMDQIEWAYVAANERSLRWVYAIRNFINVYDALFVRGRAFLNTTIFCALSIIAALLINPLAAYAMSRFQLPGTYKFLLLLMVTVSFPPMVAMIPTFIMLREMSMLNTFWALVLPTAANGYMIFLLKGFFDSLPQDLYHAALIDGAGEVRMFFQITMALSKPILAVVALGAFNSAYLTFLYALIVCPSQDMWMLSVWLFQYQTQVGMGGMFASILVAAIPPLVIFVFAQNVIMRGIVVPVEK